MNYSFYNSCYKEKTVKEKTVKKKLCLQRERISLLQKYTAVDEMCITHRKFISGGDIIHTSWCLNEADTPLEL